MHPADLALWADATARYIDGARFLSQVTRSTPLFRGILGEVLTVQQLLRTHHTQLILPDSEISYLGSSKKGYDIMLKLSGREIKLECKTKSKQKDWVRIQADKYIEITHEEATEIQHIGNARDVRDDLWWVFVDLRNFVESGKSEFYVLTDMDAKEAIRRRYKERWEGKSRPNSKKSPDTRLSIDNLLDVAPDCRKDLLDSFPPPIVH